MKQDNLKCPDHKNFEEITESIHVMDDHGALDKALANENSRRASEKAMGFNFSDNSVGHFLKIMMLSGCLILQGSQPAVAASDFSSGLLSNPYFSDLGDISTGFASVRKISL